MSARTHRYPNVNGVTTGEVVVAGCWLALFLLILVGTVDSEAFSRASRLAALY